MALIFHVFLLRFTMKIPAGVVNGPSSSLSLSRCTRTPLPPCPLPPTQQYSVGKTTFIQWLLGQDFPGMAIGPEPTTDRFLAVLHGPEDKIIPGHALAVHPALPFTALNKFGSAFLNRLQGAQTTAELAKHITLIDTPGVLAGEKQRVHREYDFTSVVQWYAERADLILCLFDSSKLDISDEFRGTLMALRGQEDKVRIVLNKADRVTGQQLMRVYGALMWSLGKVIPTPEVVRVYIGSYWNEDYMNKEFESLFIAEGRDLLADLRDLPRNAAIRKINEMVKRARLLRVHALIIGHLKAKMPSLFGKEKKQKKLLDNIREEFFEVYRRWKIPQGDFPNPDEFAARAGPLDFSKFPKADEKLNAQIDALLKSSVPRLLDLLQKEEAATREAAAAAASGPLSTAGDSPSGFGGAAAAAAAPPLPSMRSDAPPLPDSGGRAKKPKSAANPFGSRASVSPARAAWESLVRKDVRDGQFAELEGADSGTVEGGAAYAIMVASGLPEAKLQVIWDLADIDCDGALTSDEFAVAMYLIEDAKTGAPVPRTLPAALNPPETS